ncbi:MAG: hypothetical protein B7Y84_09100, partial [Azorhizobium sp. 32-67-21]
MDAGAREKVFQVSSREAGQATLARLLGDLSVRREVTLVLLACLVGVLAGSGATLMSVTAHAMHQSFFHTGPGG